MKGADFMSEQENILKLKAMIEASDNIVFFGGAGVSTESGIPDFRSETGIYNTGTDSISYIFYEKAGDFL